MYPSFTFNLYFEQASTYARDKFETDWTVPKSDFSAQTTVFLRVLRVCCGISVNFEDRFL